MQQLRYLRKYNFAPWVDALKAAYRVVGPVKRHGRLVLSEVASADDLTLEAGQTAFPPKRYLFPPREQLLRYRLDGSSIETRIDARPTVILGVHTCDMHAVTLFDHIFQQGFVDQHYQARREQLILVSVACAAPCSEHAFCRDMGSWQTPETYDLHLTDLGHGYAVQVGSVKGEQLIAGCEQFVPATDDARVALNRFAEARASAFPLRLETSAEQMRQLLGRNFEHPLWKALGDRCLACGMCTQVCPTCVCFDVTDEADLTLSEGERVRRWDSCQMREFALVAGGHNFRRARAARQRHRFMRKGKYMTDAYGVLGCVGCGRCATTCLVHITPIDVINTLSHQDRLEEVPA